MNRDKKIAAATSYAKRPEVALIQSERRHRRRALRKQAVTIPFTADELAARLSMFAGCWVCGDEPTTVDHVKPLSEGGPHMLANLRPACLSCNSRKHATWSGVRAAIRHVELLARTKRPREVRGAVARTVRAG